MTDISARAATATLAAAVLVVVAACSDNSAPTGQQATRPSAPATVSPSEGPTVKIRMTVDGRTVEATLDDSRAGRDFAALLPTNLSMSDFADTEKIADLPRRLDTTGAPAGTAARAGDICYYAPWGNLAIFYKDHGRADGLIKVGRIDAGLDVLTAQTGTFTATVEPAA